MAGTARVLTLVAALGLLAGTNVVLPQETGEEEQIFPAGQEPGDENPRRPTRAYWKIILGMRVEPSDEEAWVRSLLPLSDAHQTIVSRSIMADGFGVGEDATGENLVATWRRPPQRSGEEIRLELSVETTDLFLEPGTGPFPPSRPAAELREFLEPSSFIQSDHAEIRRQAREIVRSAKRVDEAAWALYQFTASFLKTDPATEKVDALSVLRENKGSGTGKARLLAALLRSVGIPARLVGGLRLRDASRTRGTISWVEAHLGDGWFPMDPTHQHFGFVPNRYLTLYRGDLPLIVHRTGLSVDYDFRMRQVTRRSTYEAEEPTGPPIGGDAPRSEVITEEGLVHTVASYVERAVATVVILTDEVVPEAVTDRLRSEATERGVNLVVLMSPYESRYFRETTLQELVASHAAAIREAHVVLVATRDDAGLYSLLALGERGIELHDSRIVVTGDFPRRVGTVLGAVLYETLDPGELALFAERADLLALWGIARANLIDGVPILEAAEKWGIRAEVIDAAAFGELPLYRRLIVKGWARAVHAQVPLQALTLILVLPVIALIVVAARSFVGLATFGTFSPVVVSLAFLATGVPWGVLIFVVIVGMGALLRNAIQRLRLHLVARLGILICLISVLMAGLTVLGATMGIGALLRVSLFPMVIMSVLIENFTATQIEFGTREAIRTARNTLLLCIVCAVAVESGGLPSILLAFPELLVVVLLLEVGFGKWRGLRLLEFKRFYDLLRRARAATRSGSP